jgi:hypothetical protein
MFRWLGRLLPETLFARPLSPAGERRLRLAQARAEEALTEAHVRSALLFVDALAEDASYDRAIEIYVRELGLAEPLASTVATRALVKLGEALDPAVTEPAPPPAGADADLPPEPSAEAEEPPGEVLRLEGRRSPA